MRVADIVSAIDRLAPFGLAEDWDNVGLLVGGEGAPVTRVLVALDARPAVVEEAAARGCDLLLTHHPLVFPSLRRVTTAGAVGRTIMAAVKADVAVVAAHTNLDAAPDGLNDHLAAAIGLEQRRPLAPHPEMPETGLGRVGEMTPVTVAAVASRVASALGLPAVRFTGDPGRPVRVAACCTGSGAGLMEVARAAGADVFVTGDLKYHDADRADGLALVAAPHAATEDWALRRWYPALADVLRPVGVECVYSDIVTDPWTPTGL